MKLCCACKHFLPREAPNTDDCALTEKIEPVHGKPRWMSCFYQRTITAECGPEAKHFEPAVVEAEA